MAKRKKKSASATGRHGYPRPLLRRERWVNLNGTWEFAIDAQARWEDAEEVKWEHAIEVPFAPETPASAVGETGFFKACWYRRAFVAPEPGDDERVILHFGAVDTSARV